MKTSPPHPTPPEANHSRGLLDQNPNATIIQTHMREQEVVLDHPETRQLLDFSQPIALLVVGVLLYLPDPQTIELIRGYRQHLAAGSLIAVSTLTDEHADPALRDEVQRLRAAYAEAGEPVHPRDHAEISPWFEGLALVEPGLVPPPGMAQHRPVGAHRRRRSPRLRRCRPRPATGARTSGTRWGEGVVRPRGPRG
ncbi:SAM-dependent methyltransferase [Saccharopolyspora tripterygii]